MTDDSEPAWVALFGPTWLHVDDVMRYAIICDNGFPTDRAELLDILEQAWQRFSESIRRRGLPRPPGGWALTLDHPDGDWRQGFAPEVVAQVERDLPNHPPTAVVVAVRLVRKPA
jgi:hypothetical protein